MHSLRIFFTFLSKTKTYCLKNSQVTARYFFHETSSYPKFGYFFKAMIEIWGFSRQILPILKTLLLILPFLIQPDFRNHFWLKDCLGSVFSLNYSPTKNKKWNKLNVLIFISISSPTPLQLGEHLRKRQSFQTPRKINPSHFVKHEC